MIESDEEKEDGAGHERWLVSYADFITLLFAFFAVLYATSSQDVEKTKQFQDSIKRFLIKAGAFGGSGETVNQGEKYNSPIEPPIPTFATGTDAAREVLEQIERLIEADWQAKEKSEFLYEISMEDHGVRLVLAGEKIFAKNSAQFQPGAVPFLDKLASLIGKVNREIRIEGHMPAAAGTNPNFPSTWEFASARASSLVRYMVKRHKFEPGRLVVISHGDSRPIISGSSRDAVKRNQRLEVVFVADEG